MSDRGVGPVTISSPARIHINSIEMSGTFGRFGNGLGLAIRDPRVTVIMEEAEADSISGEFSEIVGSLLGLLRDALPSRTGLRVTCQSAIPNHCGLGSETMLSLCVGEAYALMCGAQYSPYQLARIVRCSSHSGVGLATYEEGGFVVDCGYTRSSLDAMEPVRRLLRLPVPPEWRVIMVQPPGSGFTTSATERGFWENRDPIPEEEAATLARATLSLLLPSIVQGDFDGFCRGLEVVVGGGFKRQERAMHGKGLEEAIQVLRSAGAPVVGMTSGGPTLYTFALNEEIGVQQAARIGTLLGGENTAQVWVTAVDDLGRQVRRKNN